LYVREFFYFIAEYLIPHVIQEYTRVVIRENQVFMTLFKNDVWAKLPVMYELNV